MLTEIIFITLNLHIELLDTDLLWLLDSWLVHLCALHLHIRFFDVFALLDLFVHFTQFALQSFLLLVLSVLIRLRVMRLSRLHGVLIFLAKRQIAELTKNTNILQLFPVANQLGVAELRRVVGFKVRKFAKEAGNLGDDAEEIVRGRVVVHLETLNGFVVFDHWVEGPLLKLLPVPTEVIFSVGVEQKEEVFNI